jgi:YjbE family integral membrane protein
MFLLPQLFALAQIVIIDLSLAADNAVVIGAAAAGLPKDQRHRAVAIGLGGAVAVRIVLACFAVKLLDFAGVTLAGGLLLLWVAWKMIRQIRQRKRDDAARPIKAPKKLSDAAVQILIADLGMSLDNILGVAGAAHNHYIVLALGLILSVALVGAAATASAKLFHRFPWLGWFGIATVVYVALSMMASGFGALTK